MSKELVIGSNHHETKVAILEDDQLVEVYFQRANEYSLAGSIHKGRVTRVLPGMQSAFVDLGLERDTFLYVSDFFEENEDIDTVVEEPRPARQERGRGRGDRNGGDRGGNRNEGQPRRQAIAAPAEVQSEVLLDEATPPSALRFDDELDLPAAEPVDSPMSEAERTEAPLQAGLSSNVATPQTSAQPGNEHRERGRGGDGRSDDRHRRGRRRRSRGHGFPDSKYAQPGQGHSAETAPPPDREFVRSRVEPNSSVDTEAAVETTKADVMVLPGESLAKYRRPEGASAEPQSVGPVSEVEELVREAVQAEREEFDVEPEVEASEFSALEPEEGPIDAQAEELAFADRVFAHNDGESRAEVEEKLEDVAEDAAPEPPAQAFETGHAMAVPFEEQASVESAVLLENAQPLTTFEANAPFAERLGESESEPALEEAGGEPGAELPQSAVLREGSNNRPLQRSSRRMRRRRGGHRFERQGTEAGPGTAASAGSGAAAAPALQAEPILKRPEEAPETAERQDRPLPSIADLLKAGQEIIVQIAKEPLGQKGARITSHVALPGRYVVFMPSVAHLGVSRKIASDEERQRLKRILQAHRSGAAGGFIVRTAGEGIPEDEIAADMNFLYNLWLDIRQKAEKKPAPLLLHCDLDIVQRILRDQVTDEYKSVWVDNEDMYESILTFVQRFQPTLVNRVKMYTRPTPIFDAFNITAELEKALRPKVWLKSGGYIVINQTEALVAIDINTGKFVGKSNRLEDTIVKTNTEAVKEIVRQIRLRDLGGIIVVDFIDMDERKNRQKVMQALEEAMRADQARPTRFCSSMTSGWWRSRANA